MYLKLSNAVIFGVTFSALLMLMVIILRKVSTENGWRDVCQYIKMDWLRSKNRGGLIELTIAFSAIMLGAAFRSGTIASWRMFGADYTKFPVLLTSLADVILVTGVLCAMRVIGLSTNRFNWPWMAALGFAASLGAVSMLFPLGSVPRPDNVAEQSGDCHPMPDRLRQWLSRPITKEYDGGVECRKP